MDKVYKFGDWDNRKICFNCESIPEPLIGSVCWNEKSSKYGLRTQDEGSCKLFNPRTKKEKE